MLTAAQICSKAASIAKGPGFLLQAGQDLNLVLEALVIVFNLKMNRVTHTLTLPANTFGPLLLPLDYLRTYDLFFPMPSAGQPITSPGIPIFLNPITTEQMDREFKDPSTADWPYEFSTDLSPQADNPATPGLLFVYPMASGQLDLTHRYMVKRPDIAAPESSATIPWFPYTDYLVRATACRVMELTGDDRKAEFEADCARMLQPYLISDGDEQSTVHEIKLDPRHFRTNRSLRLTKNSPI
jgi:hypothetical protein